MSATIHILTVRNEQDAVAARQRARQIARLLGFDTQDQTRISTSVSEIVRNAYTHAGGGRVEYLLEGRSAPQLFIVRIADSGPGIPAVDQESSQRPPSAIGMGIAGARRLMDQFQIDSVPGRGTTVLLKKLLPRRSAVFSVAEVSKALEALIHQQPLSPFGELQHQNQELLRALDELRSRQADLNRLNRELEDTNRGVVALYAELEEKADHLRRADQLKSRFLSNMSHEFRSPLNSILALAGLLLDRSDGDLNLEQAQQVSYIRKAAQDLLDLVSDLLDLAKVEAGKVEAKPAEFEATNVFAALRGMLRPLLLNPAVNLVFEETSNIPPLFTDEGKVSQILRNFISNALKFTERGEIRVSAVMAGDQVRFTVRDTGIGIASENLDLIFQEFGQVDSPIQRRVHGTGLGLPLSRKLAILLGGRVAVESELGVGSTFSLQIPAQYREETTPMPQVEMDRDELGIPVLVVEDNQDMSTSYRKYLTSAGFHMIPAATPREAEATLEQILPAAIILNIGLHPEDAWAFAARLKQDDRTRHIAVIIVSAVEDESKVSHLGVERFLRRPAEGSALIRELRALTGQPPLFQVLIIDDEERDRYLLKQRLRNLPLMIEEASSATEGIRRVPLYKPDLIFLDLVMPDLSGFEVLKRLKNESTSSEIPVVVVTSRVLTNAEREELLSRAREIVSKEVVSRTDFAEVIRRAAGESFSNAFRA